MYIKHAKIEVWSHVPFLTDAYVLLIMKDFSFLHYSLWMDGSRTAQQDAILAFTVTLERDVSIPSQLKVV